MVFLNRYIVVSALAIFACMITPTEQQLTVRIYTNLAEIIEPVTKLPLEFSINDWNDILSDSITLLGTNLTVLSQSIIQKTNSINAAQVYIRSPISSCTTSKPLIKATIIDDKTYSVKVKVNDELVAGKVLYFTVQKQDIFYLVEDIDPIVQVDFTYTSSSRRIHANYLRRGLSWQAQYQLNIQGNRSDLFVFANIRNNLNSPLSITQAELSASSIYTTGYYPSYGETTADEIYTINKPFVIDSQANYIVSLFRTNINFERFNKITKWFSETLTSGYSQRYYRLTSQQKLLPGSCIIRESDQVLAQIYLPYLTVNQSSEFLLGQYSDVYYTENVTRITSGDQSTSTTQTTTTNIFTSTSYPYYYDYDIRLQLKNLRTYPVQVEYEQNFYYYYYYRNITLVQSSGNACRVDGSLVKCKFTLRAIATEVYSYRVQWNN